HIARHVWRNSSLSSRLLKSGNVSAKSNVVSEPSNAKKKRFSESCSVNKRTPRKRRRFMERLWRRRKLSLRLQLTLKKTPCSNAFVNLKRMLPRRETERNALLHK